MFTNSYIDSTCFVGYAVAMLKKKDKHKECSIMKTVRPPKRFRLLAECESQGLRTYAEIGAAAGLARDTVAQIVGGWRFPGALAQVRLSCALGITPQRLERLL